MDPTKSQTQENTTALSSPDISGDELVIETSGWDVKATKRLLWKLDLNIVPFMSLIYLYVLDACNVYKMNIILTK